MSVGSRGEVQGKGQTVRRVTGECRECRERRERRRCGGAEGEVWCRADESVVGVKREAVGFQTTFVDGLMMICAALHCTILRRCSSSGMSGLLLRARRE